VIKVTFLGSSVALLDGIFIVDFRRFGAGDSVGAGWVLTTSLSGVSLAELAVVVESWKLSELGISELIEFD